MGELIDLATVGRASRPLARWWNKLLEHGDADLMELERARRALDELPPQPGRLGRAIALVVGARGAPDADVVGAVELLCLAATRAGAVVAAPSGRSRRGQPSRFGEQPALPGLA